MMWFHRVPPYQGLARRVVVVGFGALLLKEPFGPAAVVGAAIALAGVATISIGADTHGSWPYVVAILAADHFAFSFRAEEFAAPHFDETLQRNQIPANSAVLGAMLIEREAQATASLNSPHTIQVFDFGITEEGTFYYVMELLAGRDLETLVRDFGPLPADRAIFLLRQKRSSGRQS